MALAVALALAGAMAGAALVFDLAARTERALAVAALVVLLTALALSPSHEIALGAVQLTLPPFARSWLLAVAATTLCLTLLDALGGAKRRAAPSAVLVVVTASAALVAPEVPARLLLATVGALAAVALARSAGHARGEVVAALRRVSAGAALLAAGAALVVAPLVPLGAVETVWALGAVGIAAGIALVGGAPPAHRGPVRLAEGDAVWIGITLAVAPSALALAVLPALSGTAAAASATPLAPAATTWALLGIALAAAGTLLAAGLSRVVAYAAVGEASFTLLALAAANEPGVADALRARLAVTPLALAAGWAAAAALRIGHPSARGAEPGWARRAPLGAAALVAAPVALYAWPGSPAWDARQLIAGAALPSPLGGAVAVACALPFVVAVLRALAAGVARPTGEREPVSVRRQARPRQPWREPAAGALAVAVAALAMATAAGVLGLGGPA